MVFGDTETFFENAHKIKLDLCHKVSYYLAEMKKLKKKQ